MRLNDLLAKNIAIWGFGQEGQSICRRIKALNPQASICIFDDKPDVARKKVQSLDPTLDVHMSTVIAKADIDVVIKSPGISLYRTEIDALRQRQIPITSVSSLWFSQPRSGRVIAVSGTKGKSTSASLLAHMIKQSGKSVMLAGNIGLALSECWPDETEVDYWVIELSSYQLADLSAEFDALIITNVYQDHLHWHGTVDQYQRDKLASLEKVIPGGMIVAPEYIEIAREDVTHISIGEDRINRFHWDNFAIYADDEELFRIDATSPIHGRHNLHNATIALAMLDSLGFDAKTVLGWIRSYSPLPHRLQLVGRKNDISFINDSISTTPQSTIAALQAFHNANDICLIVGGQNREVDLGPLVDYLKEHESTQIFALPDTGAKVIEKTGRGSACATLDEAVAKAYSSCATGGVILMSPGAASFNQFDNYQDRGNRFIELFEALDA